MKLYALVMTILAAIFIRSWVKAQDEIDDYVEQVMILDKACDNYQSANTIGHDYGAKSPHRSG